MTADNIIQFMNLLGLDRIKRRGEWVMSSCPLAKFTHNNGTDKRPSFGISIGKTSFFNCFACQSKGILSSLPSILSFHSGDDYSKLSEFLIKNDSNDFDDYDSPSMGITAMPLLSKLKLENFKDVPDWLSKELNLDDNIISEFLLRYDEKNERLIVPIFDSKNRFVGIRTRYVGNDDNILKNYKFIPYEGGDFKYHGVWYGVNKPLVRGKAIVVTEGESDLWALYKTGLISNIWASVGASIASPQIFTLQQVYNPIILFMDDDEAGWNASNKIASKLMGLTKIFKITNFHGCKDAKQVVESNKLNKVLKSMKEIV